MATAPRSRRPARWRRRKEARPSEILDAALETFVERGFAAARLDDVAARAGVTKGTIYLYFSSKEELFKAIVRQTLLPNLARFEVAAAAPDAPARDRLQQLLAGFADLVANARVAAMPKLILAEAGNFPDLARFYVEEVVERARRLIKSILRYGIERGEFRPDIDVDHVVYCVLAPMLLSALWKHALEPHDAAGPLDAPTLARVHLDVLMRGLAADKDGP